MSDLRLFSGMVQMREDRPGVTDLHNEHWVGWYYSQEQAVGDWIGRTTAKYPKRAMSYHACHDVTDVALRNLQRPTPTNEGGER